MGTTRIGRELQDQFGLSIPVPSSAWAEIVPLKLDIDEDDGAAFYQIWATGSPTTSWYYWVGYDIGTGNYFGSQVLPGMGLSLEASTGDQVELWLEGDIDVAADADDDLRLDVGIYRDETLVRRVSGDAANGVAKWLVDDAAAGSTVTVDGRLLITLNPGDLSNGRVNLVLLYKTANTGDPFEEANDGSFADKPIRFRARVLSRKHGTKLIGIGQSLHNTPGVNVSPPDVPLTALCSRFGEQNISPANIAYSGTTYRMRYWAERAAIPVITTEYRNNVVIALGGYSDLRSKTIAQCKADLASIITFAKANGVNAWVQSNYPPMSVAADAYHGPWAEAINELHAEGLVDAVVDCYNDEILGDIDVWFAGYTLDGIHWNLAGVTRFVDLAAPIIAPFLI